MCSKEPKIRTLKTLSGTPALADVFRQLELPILSEQDCAAKDVGRVRPLKSAHQSNSRRGIRLDKHAAGRAGLPEQSGKMGADIYSLGRCEHGARTFRDPRVL